MDTSLHIALCDSDPGDRRQMERLLGRESDKRIGTTGGFYVDTFGGVEAIINSPILYDVYFLDSTDPVCDSYGIATSVRNKGILSPVVYCVGSIDYRLSGPELPNSLYIDKPIKTAELSDLLDEIIKDKKENYIPTIELRNQYETFYVKAEDILYFTGNGYTVDVHMTDGSIRQATSFIDSLWRDLYSFHTFQVISPTTIVNTAYIASLGPMSLMMRDSTKHTVKAKYFPVIKKKWERYE